MGLMVTKDAPASVLFRIVPEFVPKYMVPGVVLESTATPAPCVPKSRAVEYGQPAQLGTKPLLLANSPAD